MRTVTTVDLFCGAGGAEEGLSLAIRDLGMEKHGVAINHWDVAVATMRSNHRDTETIQMDLATAVPSDVMRGRRKVDLLWASPSCTHHSRAKGGKPRDNQQRAQPELIMSWLDQLNVVDLVVENVPEFMEWGPLLAGGNPDEKRKGACFLAWINSIQARGYKVEYRILNCADYGDATTRRRFFLRARKISYIGKLGPIMWPEQTHTDIPGGGLFGLKQWRGIAECLDMTDLGRSAIYRKKPLSGNTWRRLIAGLRRYYGAAFVFDMLGQDKPEEASRTMALDEPIATQPTANRFGVANPLIVRLNKGCTATPTQAPIPTVTAGANHYMMATPVIFDFLKNGTIQGVDKPMPAQPTHSRCAMLAPVIVDMSHPGQADDGSRVRASTAPAATITGTNNFAVAAPIVVDYTFWNEARSVAEPVATQTTVRNHALCFPVVDGVQIVDILIRMLKPSEIAAAHSFPHDYILTGNTTEQVRQIGNSVPVETARAICRAALLPLSGKRQKASLPRQTPRTPFRECKKNPAKSINKKEMKR